MILTPEGDTTVLTYTAKASVGGKLAQIGQRLIDGAAKQIADDFFKRFSAALDTRAGRWRPIRWRASLVGAAAASGTPIAEPAGAAAPRPVAGRLGRRAYRRGRNFAAGFRAGALAAAFFAGFWGRVS